MQNKISSNWVLLRGLTRESGHWGDFVPKLKTAFPDANIYPIDLPGTGIYHNQSSPNNIPAITAHIRATLRESGRLTIPVNLLGVSLGGMVALNWLQAYPEEITTGILINISLAGLNPFYQRLRWQALPAIVKIIVQPSIYKREFGIIMLVSNRKERYLNLAKDWHCIQVSHPVSLVNAFTQFWAAKKYRPTLTKPAMQLLLLNSAADRLVAPACTEKLAKLWHLPVITHPWAGHDLTTDDPEWVLSQLQNWLQS